MLPVVVVSLALVWHFIMSKNSRKISVMTFRELANIDMDTALAKVTTRWLH